MDWKLDNRKLILTVADPKKLYFLANEEFLRFLLLS